MFSHLDKCHQDTAAVLIENVTNYIIVTIRIMWQAKIGGTGGIRGRDATLYNRIITQMFTHKTYYPNRKLRPSVWVRERFDVPYSIYSYRDPKNRISANSIIIMVWWTWHWSLNAIWLVLTSSLNCSGNMLKWTWEFLNCWRIIFY